MKLPKNINSVKIDNFEEVNEKIKNCTSIAKLLNKPLPYTIRDQNGYAIYFESNPYPASKKYNYFSEVNRDIIQDIPGTNRQMSMCLDWKIIRTKKPDSENLENLENLENFEELNSIEENKFTKIKHSISCELGDFVAHIGFYFDNLLLKQSESTSESTSDLGCNWREINIYNRGYMDRILQLTVCKEDEQDLSRDSCLVTINNFDQFYNMIGQTLAKVKIKNNKTDKKDKTDKTDDTEDSQLIIYNQQKTQKNLFDCHIVESIVMYNESTKK